MLIHPQFDPVMLHLGSLSIHWYGFMYILAFLSAYLIAKSRAHLIGLDANAVSDLLFYGALGVIFGGRIGYVLLYQFSHLLENPAFIFRVWEGGMSFHGGFVGVLCAMAYFAYKYKLAPFVVLDFIALCVPLGLFFGRIGNFINGELWGRISNGGYAHLMLFPQAAHADYEALQQHTHLAPLAQIVEGYALLPRHPSQLYQAFSEGILLFLLLWLFGRKARPNMAISAVFLLGYGASRLVTEFFRAPDAGYTLFFGWMTKGQLYSLPMLVLGLVLLVLAYRTARSSR